MKNNIKDAKQLPKIMRGVAFFILVIGLAVFSSTSALSEEGEVKQEILDIRDRGIFILEPLLVYENAYTEQRFGAVDESTRGILSKETISRATEVLSYCGGKTYTISSVSDSDRTLIAEACYKLQDNSEDLVKQWKDKSGFLNEFALIRDAAKCDLILVHFVKAKAGSAGGWDFIFSGTVVPGTSTTVIKTALINVSSGKIIWSGSSIERDMPQKHVLIKCLKTLYASFPGYSKK